MAMKDLTDQISPKFTLKVLNTVLLESSGLSDCCIKKINFGNKSKKGDSYLSTLTKFTVDAVGKTESGKEKEIFLAVIVKSIPKNEARRKTFRSADYFATEIYFYEKVWKEIEEFKKSKNINIKEVPRLLSSFSDGVNDYIALEDLCYEGYTNVNREQGVDYAHTLMIIRILAKFHALSIALKDQNPSFKAIASGLKESTIAEKYRSWYSGFHKKLFKIYEHAVDTELAPQYLEKLRKLFENDFYGLLCKMAKIDNKFSVVTQGDSWIPNFLFKYDETNKPIDSLIIDFQLARYTTLSTDLSFLLYACVSEEILLNKWDELIQEYYNALSDRIEELGSSKDLINLEELKEDFQKYAIFGFGMAMEAKLMSYLDDDEVPDIDSIEGDLTLDAVWNIPPFKSQEKNQKLAFLVKHVVDKGFLDLYI